MHALLTLVKSLNSARSCRFALLLIVFLQAVTASAFQTEALFGYIECNAPPKNRRHEAFQPQWQRVLRQETQNPFFNAAGSGFSDLDAQTWRNLLDYTRNKPDMDVLRLVNGYFNYIPYGSDKAVWGRDEYWASPREFMSARRGDSEDCAIAKYFALRYLGFDSSRMRIVVVVKNVSDRKLVHTVLSVRCNGVWHILDSGARPKDAVFPHTQYGEMMLPLYAVNEDGAWVYLRPKYR